MKIADRYELGDIIGTGGMSDVYAATDTVLGRDVAVKMLKVDMARDENFRERFRQEAKNSARLNHPNIVAVYDTGAQEVGGVDVPFIVMERVNGRNLRDIVRVDGPLPPRDAAALLRVLDGEVPLLVHVERAADIHIVSITKGLQLLLGTIKKVHINVGRNSCHLAGARTLPEG